MTKHITEQPWYDYQRCLFAAADAFIEGEHSVGSIFQVWIPDSKKVYQSFWAICIQDTGPMKDCFRICLYRELLIAQRMLRDLPTPEPKKKKLASYMTGYNLNAVITDDWKF